MAAPVTIDQLTAASSLSAGASVAVVQSGDTLKVPPAAFVHAVEAYGAVGNGTSDDTSAIQAAFTAMSSLGGGVVRGWPGKTYIVSFVGTKTINSTAYRYCLLQPDNVHFDLNGATLKLADSQNAAMILNSSAESGQNADIGVSNGWLDGNQANQTSPATGEMACVFYFNVLRPRVFDLKAKNIREYAGRFLNIDRGYFNNLNCVDSDGDGWSFGTTGAVEFRMFRSFVDNIYAKSCAGTFGTLEGNGFIGVFVDCQVGKVQTENCAGGVKIQNSGSDSSFGQIEFRGGALSTTNSGVKIQGSGAGLSPSRMSVGSIISRGAVGYGCYLFDLDDCQIGSISSYGDATGAGLGAVHIDQTVDGLKIGSIHVEEAGQEGIDCRGVDVWIGSATIRNSGNAVAAANLRVAATCDGLYIGKLISEDDQGTKTANAGVNLISGCKNINFNEYHSRGDYTVLGQHLVDGGVTNFRLGTYRIDDDFLYQPQTNTTQTGNVGGGEDDLQTLTIPARSLYANGKGYRIRAHFIVANNSNPKTFKLYFGSQVILTTALTINQAAHCIAESIVIRTGSNAQEYNSFLLQGAGTTIVDTERANATQTDTSAIIVKGTGTVTDGGGGINNNDIDMRSLVISPL